MSMKNRLWYSFTAILLIQTVLLLVLVLFGGISESMRSNAITIFQERTENGKLNLERDLVQHWMTDIRSSEAVREMIEDTLEEKEKTAKDMKSDPELNQQILVKCIPQVIDLLHRSYGNGVFLVLDGPASVGGSQGEKASVYIRDMDTSSYAMDNSDLLLRQGIPAVSREYGIPLESFWTLGAQLDPADGASEFFYKPYDSVASEEIMPKDAENYAYLGPLIRPEKEHVDGVVYSVPLTLSDGTTIGVIGGEMLSEHVRALMEIETWSGRTDTVQLLARSQKDSGQLTPIVTSGAVYDQFFGKENPLSYHRDQASANLVSDRYGDTWILAAVPLQIYNYNTPFEQDEWMVVSLQRQSTLLSFFYNTRNSLVVLIAVSLLLSILATVLVGELTTRPIQKLIQELRTAEIGQKIKLKQVHISEINELVDAIETLSTNVAESTTRITRILDAAGMPIGVFEFQKDTGMVFCSSSLFRIVGLPPIEESYTYVAREEFERLLQVLREVEVEENSKIYSVTKMNETVYLRLRLVNAANGDVTGVMSDVTQELGRRRRLEKERNYDLLTNIYNRRAFFELVEGTLHGGTIETAAFVMWDLDNLKYVNDTYGHETGDRYIRLFADSLRSLEADGAIVGRHSGDEFMAFVYGDDESGLWQRIRQFMLDMKGVTLNVAAGYHIPLRASAGVAWYPRHAKEYEVLLRYADFAMYIAKHSVKGIVQEFDEQTYYDNSYLISGREELNRLLDTQNVKFALQPIVARDGSIYGYEALMRPQLQHLKNITEVLNLAKSQAKLSQFEELTWFGALSWLKQCEGQLEADSHLFINSISSAMLTQQDILRVEKEYPELLGRLVLEITETEQMDEHCQKQKVETLHRWGGLIAIDDFGTGYSNDGALLTVMPDLVKLDMEIVRRIHEDENRQVLARNLIDYCHKRGILVIAEGVETLEELEILMSMQADLFQGYYMGRPELEIRPINPYVVCKMRELSQK
ncbi:MAG: EAL domain-containing protein [Lachnospiraceae bacterium]|nr:EAL domain-containing protein [Lachnospiraceae bacterium]